MDDNELPPIRDNEAAGRWEVTLDGETAFLEYSRGPSVLVLSHTEIPEALGGRGIASRLVRHGLDVAGEAGLKAEAVCPFAMGWLDRHPEYGDAVRGSQRPATEDPFWF